MARAQVSGHTVRYIHEASKHAGALPGSTACPPRRKLVISNHQRVHVSTQAGRRGQVLAAPELHHRDADPWDEVSSPREATEASGMSQEYHSHRAHTAGRKGTARPDTENHPQPEVDQA